MSTLAPDDQVRRDADRFGLDPHRRFRAVIEIEADLARDLADVLRETALTKLTEWLDAGWKASEREFATGHPRHVPPVVITDSTPDAHWRIRYSEDPHMTAALYKQQKALAEERQTHDVD